MPTHAWCARVAAGTLLAACAAAAEAAITAIKTYGDGDGSERCLVGDAHDRCTRGGRYKGAFSIVHIYATNSGRTLVRLDDSLDKVWSAPLGYLEVRAVAHYLSGHGTSVAGIGVDKNAFESFPAGVELAPPDNVVVGPALATDKVQDDHAAPGSFMSVLMGEGEFYFLYRSQGKTYSSNNHAGNGFDNGNGGRRDHMVSWAAGFDTDLQGNTAAVYLVAFERAHADDDFQDGVYEVRIPWAAPPPVPEPSTFAALLLGAALLLWRARLPR